MKTFFIASILLLLQGCLYQSVDDVDILLANEKCIKNGGVSSIDIFAAVSTIVECKDGTSHSFSPIAKDLYITNKANNLASPK
ncbi:MAG: hypothetical protein A6F70_01470 [Cycloclasticus sp. symbiont of Bathymodiolus heckerae]|nr:MAG: hypothetical protein A6F70_01470 [Cycloclasticus sp. symbiont of Bathymodiolus heckerae]